MSKEGYDIREFVGRGCNSVLERRRWERESSAALRDRHLYESHYDTKIQNPLHDIKHVFRYDRKIQ